MNSKVLLGLLVFSVVFIAACTSGNDTTLEEVDNSGKNWRDIQLKDVSTGETFTVNEFTDKPILLESFAVWCPTCTKQQKEIKELHDRTGNNVISISLNTDPNEDEAKVLEHIQRNGFDWRYAIAPSELTQQLIDEFGVRIINPPSSPVVLICDGHAELLQSTRVKSEVDLKNEIRNKCSGEL